MTRTRALEAALVVSVLVVLAAPFLRSVQKAAEALLGEGLYVPVLGVAFAVAVGAVLAWTLWRIRDHLPGRYLLLATAVGLMGLQIFGWNRGIARTDAVERIHFLFYGLLAVLYYRVFRSWGGIPALLAVLLAVTTVGSVDEWLQWLVPVRTGDWFDVLLNSYAGLCGLLYALAVEPPKGPEWRARPGSWRRLARLAALALLVLASFLHCAHLGYAHFDEELGARFRSFFTLEELRELSRRRAAEWAERPPPPLHPLQVEDYFRSEAGWRVAYRNAAIESGLLFEAFEENRILETYYAPFLDLGHSLSGRAKERLEAAHEPDRIYHSPAVVDRVFVRPSKPVFWAAVVTAMGALLVASRVPRRPSD